MKRAKSSIVAIATLALLTFVLVAGVLTAAQKKTPVLVAARALEAGTKLSLADVEVVQVHAGAALEGAFETVEDVTGLVITVQRLPGDQVTADMVGDSAQNALAQALEPDHRAVAIHVDQASGLAGLLRPGDSVSAIAIVDPSTLGLGLSGDNPGPEAKVMLANLKVLFVPWEFRYREISDPEDGGMSPAVASSSGRETGVIVLSAPMTPITVTWELTPVLRLDAAAPITNSSGITDTSTMTGTGGIESAINSTPVNTNPVLRVSPLELLALLDAKAQVYLVLEPSVLGDKVNTPGIFMRALIPAGIVPQGETTTSFVSFDGETQ